MNPDPSSTNRTEIHDVVMRYCRGIDRLEMDLVRSAYHPDGIDHHTGFSGSVSDFIVWVQPKLASFSGTMHFIGNHLAEIDGDAAVAESYGQAVHWNDHDDDARLNFTSGFRYIDHMTRINGRWAIAERWAVREWTRSDAGRYMPKEGHGPSPSRDATDPVLQLRRHLFG